MKIILIPFVFITFLGYSQTLDIELENLKKQDEKHKKQWNQFFDKIKEYPDYCFNEKERDFLCDFTFEVTKGGFETIKEWVAITFKDYNAVVNYSNEQTGKMILKPHNSFSSWVYFKSFGTQKTLTEFSSSHTMIIELVNNKVRVQFRDFRVSDYPLMKYFPLSSYDDALQMQTYYELSNKIFEDIDDTFERLKKFLE